MIKKIENQKWIFLFLLLVGVIFLTFLVLKNKDYDALENQKDISLNQVAVEDFSGEKPIAEDIFNLGESDSHSTEFKIGNADFSLKGNDYFPVGTDLTVKIGEKIVFTKKYAAVATTITKLVFNEKDILVINFYGSMAHCCSVAVPFLIDTNNVLEGENLFLGNNDIFNKDNFYIKDGYLYTLVYDDRFAYFDTMSFASSIGAFFPSYYELSFDPFGFRNVNNLFANTYKKQYKITQKNMEESINEGICKKDDENEDIFSDAVLRYSLGYFAGVDRGRLKSELNNDRECFSVKDLSESEDRIWRKLNNNRPTSTDLSSDWFQSDEFFDKFYLLD